MRIFMMKRRIIYILIGMALTASGCGLIPIPRSRLLPGAVASVEIGDAETGEPIPEAQVTCSYDKFVNWMHRFPVAVSNESPAPAEHVLPVSLQADGRYHIEKKRVTAFIRPVGLTPLGTTLFEDYQVYISANAPTYPPFLIVYCPYEGGEPFGKTHWGNGSVTDLTADQTLRIYLDKRKEIPVRTIEVRDLRTGACIPGAEVLYQSKTLYQWGDGPSLAVGNIYPASGDSQHAIVRQAEGVFQVWEPQPSMKKRVIETGSGDNKPWVEVFVMSISVNAPGYEPFSIWYDLTARPFGEKIWSTGNVTCLTNEGVFTIYLKEAAEPSQKNSDEEMSANSADGSLVSVPNGVA